MTMFDLVFGLLDVKNRSKTPRRILIAGNAPEPCAHVAGLLASINDFETILLEVDDVLEPEESVNKFYDVSNVDDAYTAYVPLECFFAEIKRRNWYRGHIWDFFTSKKTKASKTDDSDVRKLMGVHVIIFVTSYSEFFRDSSSAIKFFSCNSGSHACKFLVVDVSLIDEKDTLIAEEALTRFIDNHNTVRVYKMDMRDERSSRLLCKSILDETIQNISKREEI